MIAMRNQNWSIFARFSILHCTIKQKGIAMTFISLALPLAPVLLAIAARLYLSATMDIPADQFDMAGKFPLKA
jgi:hypothetical protein